MKRRKFMMNSITGLPILLTTLVLFASACEKPNTNLTSKTIIVVGAGIAGLAAARKLKASGYTVKVLESQDRIGGRLRTNRTLGFAFDEGASWIHGIRGNPITTLAQDAGMRTFETVDENRISFDQGGLIRNASVYDQTENDLYEILATLKGKGKATESFETVFNRLYPSKANDRLWKFFLSTYVTFDTGDLDKLSSLLYDEGEEYSGVEKIAINGYDTIPEYLAKGLSIELNERVHAIDYSADKVKVSHQGHISEADYVLVTVPLGVLKSNTIQFTPSLSQNKREAIQKTGMNCVNKFLLTWSRSFWDDVQYLSYTPGEKDKFNYFVNIKKYLPDTPALMTFAYAEYARRTENMTDAEVTGEIMFHLKDMYGNGIPDPTNMLRTKWQSNINSFGSYSYPAVETQMQFFNDLAVEVNNKLFFAGEHTEIDYFSTAHGAYMSGIREADKIIALG